MEEQVQGDSAAKHFGQIACPDCQFAQEPVRPACPGGIPVAATLREVFAGDHAQPRANHLHEDRHQAGKPDHPEQAELKLSAGLQVSAPVAGIHVTDADQNGGADEGAPLFPEPSLVRGHLYGAVNAFEGHLSSGLGGETRIVRFAHLHAEAHFRLFPLAGRRFCFYFHPKLFQRRSGRAARFLRRFAK